MTENTAPERDSGFFGQPRVRAEPGRAVGDDEAVAGPFRTQMVALFLPVALGTGGVR